MKSLKNRIYSFLAGNSMKNYSHITKRILYKIIDALENKNNNQNTNGEFWFLNTLKNEGLSTVFDVGANIGAWTIQVKKLFPNTLLYSFEPIPSTFNLLSTNTSNLDEVKIFNLALSNEKSQINMKFYENNSIFSSIYQSSLVTDEFQNVQVDCVRGDEFCNENQIELIDFLKIDTEGNEFQILLGFQEMIKNRQIRFIQFEYGVFSLETKYLLKDFFGFFKSHGYCVGKLYPDYIDFSEYTYRKENFMVANYVAILSDEKVLTKLKSNK